MSLSLRKFLPLALSLSIIGACKGPSDVAQPDTSSISLDYELVRYEELLKKIDLSDPLKSYQKLNADHPAFTDLYFNRVIPIFNNQDHPDSIKNGLHGFLQDERIAYLLDTVAMVHADFEKDMVPKLEQGFKNLKYYFPQWQEPNVYTLISEYAYQHFLFEDDGGRGGLAIGLDMYLGNSFPYNKIAPGVASFSEYITRTFDKDHLIKKTMDVLLDEIAGPPSGPRMLDQMIHNGKKLYIMKRLLPNAPDSIIMEYTSEQMKWASQNEEEMWAFFFKEELFYETDMITINKYINTSPDSPGMPPEAPGRTGNYMGWQIIKSYMGRNPEKPLIDLLAEGNAQKIMDASRYKPRRN